MGSISRIRCFATNKLRSMILADTVKYKVDRKEHVFAKCKNIQSAIAKIQIWVPKNLRLYLNQWSKFELKVDRGLPVRLWISPKEDQSDSGKGLIGCSEAVKFDSSASVQLDNGIGSLFCQGFHGGSADPKLDPSPESCSSSFATGDRRLWPGRSSGKPGTSRQLLVNQCDISP
ncbi:unnamed protein product [Urochloa humidicola]